MKNDEFIAESLKGILDRCNVTTGHISDIKSDLSEIKVVQAKQQVILEERIKREMTIDAKIDSISEELIPLKRHDNMWAGASKLSIVICMLVGAAAAIVKFLR